MRVLFGTLLILLPVVLQAEATLDLAINHGRVMDPASNLDAVRHVGVRDGAIVQLSKRPLKARRVVDATGLVVAPGFIDLHVHGQEYNQGLYFLHLQYIHIYSELSSYIHFEIISLFDY